jgi:hypothetical protein
VHYINTMSNGLGDWISETDIEGTCMDPEYMLRHWEATRGALWFFSDWETAMAYQDLVAFHMERAGPFLHAPTSGVPSRLFGFGTMIGNLCSTTGS